MHNKSTYLLFCLLPVLVLFSCTRNSKELPSLQETYSKSDAIPFGTRLAFQQTRQLFFNNEIHEKRTTLQSALRDNTDTGSLYIDISKHFLLSSEDRDALTNFVNNGNSAFISAEDIDTAFLSMIGFPKQPAGNLYRISIDNMINTAVKLEPAAYADSAGYSYFYAPLNNAFILPDDPLIRVLGINESGKPNYVLLYYGKGKFYLHCEPRVFSNYFLLQQDNYKYFQQVFSFMPAVPEHIFWDDFYNKRNTAPVATDGKSTFSILFQYPAMAWAFWLVLLLMALYILFGSKRRQRIIRPIAANQNTSVTFTETVSHLYLQKKDNRNIADKMITYFLEQVRTQYFLNTNHFNEEFISTLSRKSNVPFNRTTAMFALIQQIQKNEVVEDEQLLALNRHIENFYKHK